MTLPPPAPPVPLLVMLLPVVLLPPVPLPPVPPVDDEPPGWQLAVCEFGSMTQVKGSTQPHSVQSPGWHSPFFPQVSLTPQSAGPRQPPGFEEPEQLLESQQPSLLQEELPPSFGKMGQPARMPDSKPTKPSRKSRFIPSPKKRAA